MSKPAQTPFSNSPAPNLKRYREIDVLLGGLNRLVNRLSLSIVIAGWVVSLAILISVTADGSPLQVLIMAGFMTAVGLGIWLLISILRGIT